MVKSFLGNELDKIYMMILRLPEGEFKTKAIEKYNEYLHILNTTFINDVNEDIKVQIKNFFVTLSSGNNKVENLENLQGAPSMFGEFEQKGNIHDLSSEQVSTLIDVIDSALLKENASSEELEKILVEVEKKYMSLSKVYNSEVEHKIAELKYMLLKAYFKENKNNKIMDIMRTIDDSFCLVVMKKLMDKQLDGDNLSSKFALAKQFLSGSYPTLISNPHMWEQVVNLEDSGANASFIEPVNEPTKKTETGLKGWLSKRKDDKELAKEKGVDRVIHIRPGGKNEEGVVECNAQDVDKLYNALKKSKDKIAVVFDEGIEVVSLKTASKIDKDIKEALLFAQLPSSVKVIDDEAFSSFFRLQIDIPKNSHLTRIGTDAFFCCSLSQSSFDFSNMPLESIGDTAFNSTDITSILLPPSLKSIGDGAFMGCQRLEKLDLRNTSVTSIPSGMADGSGLKTILLPDCIDRIGAHAFHHTKITELDLRGLKQLRSISKDCFSESSLESILLPESITTISKQAFRRSRLREINLSELQQLESIGDEAFSQTDFIGEQGTLRLPSSVKEIGHSAFAHTSITSADLSNLKLLFIAAYLFYTSNLNSIVLPPSITSIGDDAFAETPLESIDLPEQLTSIGNDAFKDTKNLSGIDMSKLLQLRTIGSRAFMRFWY